MTTNFTSHFVIHTRADGETHTKLADDAPAWLEDAVREAHQGDLPNDWVYAECRAAAEAFDAGDLAAAEDDCVHDHADARVEVYTRELYQWAADQCLTHTFAAARLGAADLGATAEDQIKVIQYAAIRHVADVVRQACRAAVKAAEAPPW